MKTAIGAALPKDMFSEFKIRTVGFPGGKTGLIKEALRAYFAANPLTEDQKVKLEAELLAAKQTI